MLHKRFNIPTAQSEKQLQQELADIVNSDTFNEVLGDILPDGDFDMIEELEELDFDIDVSECPITKTLN
jgi:hypothetical protein